MILRKIYISLELNRINDNISVPRWFSEGFAMYYADESNLKYKLTIAENLRTEELFNIYSLNEKFYSNSKKTFTFAYAYSNILFKL